MLLTLLALSSFLSGTLAWYETEEVCYGTHYRLPSEIVSGFVHGKLFFTPSSGEARQLIGAHGEVKDARLSMTHDSLSLREVTERDEGTFAAAFFDRVMFRTRLIVKDCAKTTEKYYMGSMRHSPVDLEYVEFTPAGDQTQTKVLWNRSDPNAGRGRVHMNANVWEISEVTQNDNGFYNFRRRDNSLISRMKLIVKVDTRDYTVNEGEELVIEYPGVNFAATIWTVTFTRGQKQLLMKEGEWVVDDYSQSHSFMGRLRAERNKLTIDPVKKEDRGTFVFRDKMGRATLTVDVAVENAPTSWYQYVAVLAVFIFLLFLCGCCFVKKWCCEKDASEGSKAAARGTSAPAVYYHGATQHSGPTYPAYSRSASPAVAPSYRPLNPVLSGRVAPSHGPPTYSPVVVHDNPTWPPPAPLDTSPPPPQPPQDPQFTAPVPSFSAGSDCLSSDAELRFELKGMTFPSAPQPLGSDPPASDVYRSDKFNFL